MTVVTLVGLPGSGKSTIGRQLGCKLGLPFFDSDAEIEKRLQQPIRTFFEKEGEAAFREIEESELNALTSRHSVGVLATGGGAVLRPANRRRLCERTVVVYLHATPEQLARRLRYDTKRPLLQVADPLARLQALYAERDPLYREVAHYTVETRAQSVALLASRVMAQLELAGCMPGR